MNWKFLNVPLGINAPSGTLAKCFGEAAAANIAGNFLNFVGQMDANNINARQSERWRNTTIEQNQKNRDWQSAENRAAEAWQEKMWNLQNAYNTPTAIRKRLQEAGFNPWISGSGGGNLQSLAGSAGSGHSGSASQLPLGSPIPAQNPFGGLSNIAQAIGIDANIANQNAQTIKMASEAYTEYLKATGDYEGGQKLLKRMLAGVNRSDKYVGDLTNSLNQEYIQSKIKSDRDALEYDLRAEFGRQEAQKQIDLLDSTITKIDAEKAYLQSKKNLTDQEINESVKRVAKLIAETDTIDQSREFIVRKLEAEMKIAQADPMANGTFASMEKGMPILAKFLGLLLKVLK